MTPIVLVWAEALVYASILVAAGIALGLLLAYSRPQLLDRLDALLDPPERPEPLSVVLARLTRDER